MSDTTSIHDLPTDPANGSNGLAPGNISMSTNEKIGPGLGPPSQMSEGLSLDQTTINQIVSGLQQASSSGATQLKSRDIPQITQALTQDPQIQPHYIPPASNQDYIQEYEDNEDIIENYKQKMEYSNSLDQLYDELQVPLLIAVLFFLFQLPIFRKFLFNYFPFLFFKDGNINIYGYLFKSILFGLLYYLLFKTISQFNKF